MKKHVFLYLVAMGSILLVACGDNSQNENSTYSEYLNQENPPVITFEDGEAYNFVEVLEGEEVNHKFFFTNTGKGTLIISNVSASCGCTVPKNWPKGPIKPGEKAYVEVIFNSTGRVGVTNKIITVTANTDPSVTQIALKGEVIGPTENKLD